MISSPVRLVKMVGDAAMFVSPDAEAAMAAAIDLVEAASAEGDDFPELRAGLARGAALPRGGDWYGRPVNMAARITGIARPGSVLASEDAKDAAGDGFDYSFAGERRLKGIKDEIKLFRARHAGAARTRAGRAPRPRRARPSEPRRPCIPTRPRPSRCPAQWIEPTGSRIAAPNAVCTPGAMKQTGPPPV